jgi:hypothetical protein
MTFAFPTDALSHSPRRHISGRRSGDASELSGALGYEATMKEPDRNEPTPAKNADVKIACSWDRVG